MLCSGSTLVDFSALRNAKSAFFLLFAFEKVYEGIWCIAFMPSTGNANNAGDITCLRC